HSRDIASISEIATDGSLRRVVMSDAGTTAGTTGNEYLVDTSRLREPVRALQVAWAAGQAPFDRPYRVMASDDLKSWATVQEEGHLVELQNNGARIFKNRIELDGVKTKYLRLVPLQENQRALSLTGVSAELAPAQAEQNWQWEEVAGKRLVEKDGTTSFVYEIRGRFPFERADVALPGNSTHEWILKSRDSEESEWQFAAAPWMAFQLQGGSATNRSPPQALERLNRDRYWRLIARDSAGDTVPTLRLGYRPEVVVFLAQGNAPYALLAGSARAQRAESPLPQLVDALRAQRGQDWQPATALLGDMQPLAGAKALTPAPVERDWKAWLLWALLAGGALIVAGFAFSLLNKPTGKKAD
ncbi:MAG: DUF3999 domain-containing protein, partial [Pseudoxanthomonas sp.]